MYWGSKVVFRYVYKCTGRRQPEPKIEGLIKKRGLLKPILPACGVGKTLPLVFPTSDWPKGTPRPEVWPPAVPLELSWATMGKSADRVNK